ncbi:MAG: hypothetical protein Kow0077_02550 [Anaerolineae bacterium]
MSALLGKRVVNTRATHQASELDRLLDSQGAVPVAYPCIAIAPPEDTDSLDRALTAAAEGEYDWLVVTSANTVRALADRLNVLGMGHDALRGLHVAAVGPATADAARDLLSVTIALTPDEYIAESLAEALARESGGRVLLPQSEIARPVLAERLRAAGLTVEAVTAYRTVQGTGGEDVPGLLAQGQIDAVTFTSSSTVENFFARLDSERPGLTLPATVCLACIGPIAARTLAAHGYSAQVVPDEHTLDGLVSALARWFSENA